jgi:secondary thiamine-phosphate synthase enzyme
MNSFTVRTSRRVEFIDITSEVRKHLEIRNVGNGICVVFCPHTTAGLTINENADPSVTEDIIRHLQKLVPQNGSFSHSEGNSDAHIKSSLMGSSLNIIVADEKLMLGTWQGIYFCEFDGPRNRQVFVKIIGEKDA